MSIKTQATVEDLYRVKEKAEIVNGELRIMPPEGDLPSSAAGAIMFSLHAHERRAGSGRVYGFRAAFIVDLPNRKSFCPDAAFYVGPHFGGKFLEGAPVFAVEVRSEGDYGPQAEQEMAVKRRDYFAAGTLVVWDVDVLKSETVRVYRASDPDNPAVYRRGEVAEAEPAVPGWTMAIDDLFS